LGTNIIQPGGLTVVPDGTALGGEEWNIRLRTNNTDVGIYGENTLKLAPSLSLKLAGRWNLAAVDLEDRFGMALNGDHAYYALNPSAELTWQADAATNVYIDVGQSSRTPTAAELSCANPRLPCLFPLSFISDPGLHQVIARTLDLGAKGTASLGALTLDWLGDLYDTRNTNDILFISAGPFLGSGYFANVGATERRGAEAGVKLAWRNFDAGVNYGFVNATFRNSFAELSAHNPGANADGLIFVKQGDRLPGIPLNTLSLSLGWQATRQLHLKAGMTAASSQFLRGDEANLNRPLAGHVVFNAEAEYRLTDIITLTLEAENLFDSHYATFGLYSDPTPNGALPQFSNPRFIVPGQPFGVWGGVKADW
jgi:outer membrane receptor protein involved in Fe transport